MTGDVYTVEVGYTTERPVVPDQHWTWVRVASDTEVGATLLAAQVVARRCTMVTSTRIVAVEL